LRSLQGLVTGRALSLPYYFNSVMRDWVRQIVRDKPVTDALVFSSAMAQYVEPFHQLNRIIDFVDVDSDKWRQYAARKAWPVSWIYQREGRNLLSFDQHVAARFDHALFVSEHEAALFRSLAPDSAGRVLAIGNGVDSAYFQDDAEYRNPYAPEDEVLVFTGAMDYWANVDAVTWFAQEVFPEVARLRPRARFYIVGARPAEAVTRLAAPGITVTGSVEDVRPYLAHARLVVAPLRIARGIQNKVLEGLAMGKPVLASPAAMEGIACGEPLDLKVAEAAEEWVKTGAAMLADPQLPARSSRNRSFITRQFSWDASLSRLDPLFSKID
jgi:sugar transferase (PEP-CTERM/EpsH1 system associated)